MNHHRIFRSVFVWGTTLIVVATLFGIIPGGTHSARASGNTWTVNVLADDAPGGTCAATCTLRDALNTAQTGDTINFVVSGTITLTNGRLDAATTSVTINGPGQSILDISPGSSAVPDFVVENDIWLAISNLTISGGSGLGGGITNYGVLAIDHCTFSNNAVGSAGDGAAIYNYSLNSNGGILGVTNSLFSGNSAGGGGAISNGGTATISATNFYNNTAVDAGGAISNGGTLTVSSSAFGSNSGVEGGGIFNGGTLTIVSSTFSNNSINGNGGGGAIENADSGTLNIRTSTFSLNAANGLGAGGAIYNNLGVATVSNSTFVANISNNAGGAIYNSSTLTVANSTIASNSANSGGAGIYGGLNLGSSIVADDLLGGGSIRAPDIQGSVATLGNNLVGDGSLASGLTNGQNNDLVGNSASPYEPELAPLSPVYGGPTPTLLLPIDSPAYQHGNCNLNSPASPVATDQRGVNRKSPCDTGAFEDTFSFTPSPLPNTTVGSTYNQTIAASGGVSPYYYSVVIGSLPPGLTLSSSGTLSGTPTTAGPHTFTITALDANGFAGGVVDSIVVAPQDTIGIFRPSTNSFYLKLHNATGFADITVPFNVGTRPYPVVGDWTGTGADTIGLFDQSNGLFSLRNSNTPGTPDEQLVLGDPNDMPLAGRWTAGAANAGVGVFRPSNGLIYLKNALTTGFADDTMVLGIPGDVGLAGDWSDNGYDSPGVYRPSNITFYLSNQVCNCAVFGDYAFQYGNPGDAPVVGDWIAQGYDGVGLFRQNNGYTYLRNSLTTGYADTTFVYGSPGDIPVAGHWQLTYPPAPNPVNVLVPPTTAPLAGSGQGNSNGLGD